MRRWLFTIALCCPWSLGLAAIAATPNDAPAVVVEADVIVETLDEATDADDSDAILLLSAEDECNAWRLALVPCEVVEMEPMQLGAPSTVVGT